MTKKQRENTAKYLYDVSKGILLMVVVGNFISEDINIIRLIAGGMASTMFFVWGYIIDGGLKDG